MFNILFGRISNLWEKDFLVASFLPALAFIGAIAETLALSFGFEGTVAWVESWTAKETIANAVVGFLLLVILSYVLSSLRNPIAAFWSGSRSTRPRWWQWPVPQPLYNFMVARQRGLRGLIRRKIDLAIAEWSDVNEQFNLVERLIAQLPASSPPPQAGASAQRPTRQSNPPASSLRGRAWTLGQNLRTTLSGFLISASDTELEAKEIEQEIWRLRRLTVDEFEPAFIECKKLFDRVSVLVQREKYNQAIHWADLQIGLDELHKRLIKLGDEFTLLLTVQYDQEAGDVVVTQPTRFGNITQAYNLYSFRRFQLDGETYWPQLRYLMNKTTEGQKLLEAIADRRMTLDFSLATASLSMSFAILMFVGLPFFNKNYYATIVAGTAFLLVTRIFYNAAVAAAASVGDLVRAAYDLFADKLLRELRACDAAPINHGPTSIQTLNIFVAGLGVDGTYTRRSSLSSFLGIAGSLFANIRFVRWMGKSWPARLMRGITNSPFSLGIAVAASYAIVLVGIDLYLSLHYAIKYPYTATYEWRMVTRAPIPAGRLIDEKSLAALFQIELQRWDHSEDTECPSHNRNSTDAFLNSSALIGLRTLKAYRADCLIFLEDLQLGDVKWPPETPSGSPAVPPSASPAPSPPSQPLLPPSPPPIVPPAAPPATSPPSQPQPPLSQLPTLPPQAPPATAPPLQPSRRPVTPPPATPESSAVPALRQEGPFQPLSRFQHNFIAYFGFDDPDLTVDAQKIVDAAAVAYKKGDNTKIIVTGYTDLVGSQSYNLSLSQRRAEAVRTELLRVGIPDDQISPSWRGIEDPRVPTRHGVREPQNRRVEIEF
jgi:outer membrane protein OmpA-like peptidoglycan-associated protein